MQVYRCDCAVCFTRHAAVRPQKRYCCAQLNCGAITLANAHAVYVQEQNIHNTGHPSVRVPFKILQSQSQALDDGQRPRNKACVCEFYLIYLIH